MKVLLDTHVVIWALIHPGRLSPRVTRLLTDRKTDIVVSSASIWELGIKFHNGKMPEMARIFRGSSIIWPNWGLRRCLSSTSTR